MSTRTITGDRRTKEKLVQAQQAFSTQGDTKGRRTYEEIAGRDTELSPFALRRLAEFAIIDGRDQDYASIVERFQGIDPDTHGFTTLMVAYIATFSGQDPHEIIDWTGSALDAFRQTDQAGIQGLIILTEAKAYLSIGDTSRARDLLAEGRPLVEMDDLRPVEQMMAEKLISCIEAGLR